MSDSNILQVMENRIVIFMSNSITLLLGAYREKRERREQKFNSIQFRNMRGYRNPLDSEKYLFKLIFWNEDSLSIVITLLKAITQTQLSRSKNDSIVPQFSEVTHQRSLKHDDITFVNGTRKWREEEGLTTHVRGI